MDNMIEQLLGTVLEGPTLLEFVRNIAFGALLALGLERVYIRYGHSLSNRTMFARHFYLLAMTTTLIITVVQSSLTLSLGLIGALSIVRFRAAIKEPEELVYIFLAVGMGLALGANQLIVTVVAFLTITAIIWLRHRFSSGEAENENNLFLSVVSRSPDILTVPALTQLLREQCRRFRMKRMDTTEGQLDASFLIEVESLESVHQIVTELRRLDGEAAVTVVDQRPDVGTI